jgi:hypothetical protein
LNVKERTRIGNEKKSVSPRGPYTKEKGTQNEWAIPLRTKFVARAPTGMLTENRYAGTHTAGQARLNGSLGARTSMAVHVHASEHRASRAITDQYLGSDVAPSNGHEGQFRIGFNIFRILDVSKFRFRA